MDTDADRIEMAWSQRTYSETAKRTCATLRTLANWSHLQGGMPPCPRCAESRVKKDGCIGEAQRYRRHAWHRCSGYRVHPPGIGRGSRLTRDVSVRHAGGRDRPAACGPRCAAGGDGPPTAKPRGKSPWSRLIRPPRRRCVRGGALRAGLVAAEATSPCVQPPPSASGGAPVGVVQPAEDGEGHDRARIVPRRPWWFTRHRHALAQPVVRPGRVAGGDVLAERPPRVRLAEQQQAVEALAPDTPEEALAGGVLPGRAVGRAQLPMPVAAATRAKADPYVLSRSRTRERGRRSNGVASRSCWTTRRDPSATRKKAHSGRKSGVVTGRKSHAQVSPAWWRRKVAHVRPSGRGRGTCRR